MSAPVVIGPPPSSSAPIAGNSAIGWPKVIAVMSRMYCRRMFDARRRNCQPSRSDSSPGRTSSPSGRMLGSVQSPRKSDSMRIDVDRVGPRVAGERHEDSGEGGTCRDHDPHRDAMQGRGGREQVAGEQARRDRLLGGHHDRVGRRDDDAQDVEPPHRLEVRPGEDGEDRRRREGHGGGQQGDDPPVEGIRQHPAVQTRDDHRQESRHRDHRDGERVLGEVVDVQHDGDDGELAAEPGQRRADPQACERRAGGEGPQIDEVVAAQARPSRRIPSLGHDADRAVSRHPSSLSAVEPGRFVRGRSRLVDS